VRKRGDNRRLTFFFLDREWERAEADGDKTPLLLRSTRRGGPPGLLILFRPSITALSAAGMAPCRPVAFPANCPLLALPPPRRGFFFWQIGQSFPSRSTQSRPAGEQDDRAVRPTTWTIEEAERFVSGDPAEPTWKKSHFPRACTGVSSCGGRCGDRGGPARRWADNLKYLRYSKTQPRFSLLWNRAKNFCRPTPERHVHQQDPGRGLTDQEGDENAVLELLSAAAPSSGRRPSDKFPKEAATRSTFEMARNV